MGHLDEIQTSLKPLKISEKIAINFHDQEGLAESLKTMTRTDLTQPDRDTF